MSAIEDILEHVPSFVQLLIRVNQIVQSIGLHLQYKPSRIVCK